MSFTTTITTKNQLTLPKQVRDTLGIKSGMKVNIYPTKDGFIGKVRKKSKILDFFGSLQYLDDGKPLKHIREQALKLAAQERTR